ncbi:hypothetical protein [Vibrio diabolicus]|uniref:hypothetical protein n=1 Tax=Vibrio diabolicus TaxID=50719 RepID=UPI00215F5563|nr:hypothetical protein [Vibrio diabolicus]MCS0450567.1 hypothetical protein [Vibrio diabolicus]
MKSYFFKEIIGIKHKINRLISDPEDIDCLVEIQRELLSWHFWLENAVKTRKNRLIKLKKLKRARGNTKAKSQAIKHSISLAKEQISELQDLKLWARHIGNSIPHIYYDKNDLRPYAYSTSRQELKELSGDIFGKEGQDLENEVFEHAASLGIKVLLNDLTSIMRHGDITLMNQEIPFLMELKQSDACRKKAEKQLKNMRAVQDYILTDESESLRGEGILSKRLAPLKDEHSRINEFNNHLAATMEKGANISKIDDNVYCYSFIGESFPEDLSFIESYKKPIFVSLNQLKNNLDLSLFYPFTLSIKDPEVFSAFLCGYLSIYLFIDWEPLDNIARSENVDIEIISDDYCLMLQNGDNFSAQSYTLTKALVEFTSVNWAVEQACKMYKESILIYGGVAE